MGAIDHSRTTGSYRGEFDHLFADEDRNNFLAGLYLAITEDEIDITVD